MVKENCVVFRFTSVATFPINHQRHRYRRLNESFISLMALKVFCLIFSFSSCLCIQWVYWILELKSNYVRVKTYSSRRRRKRRKKNIYIIYTKHPYIIHPSVEHESSIIHCYYEALSSITCTKFTLKIQNDVHTEFVQSFLFLLFFVIHRISLSFSYSSSSLSLFIILCMFACLFIAVNGSMCVRACDTSFIHTTM